MANRAFATVILDVDSTISGIEGISWLAARSGDIIARRVASLESQAASGVMPHEDAYAASFAAIRPRREMVDALSHAYIDTIDPYCEDAVRQLRRAGIRVILVSNAPRHALLRLAYFLGVDLDDVHAVDIRFDAIGAYAGFDASSLLVRRDGKRLLLDTLDIARPVLVVGGALSDLAMREAADAFAAFTGFVHHDGVVERADAVVESFPQLASMVLA
ncbi:MAG TPA: HAD family hydrolase [Gemmatimonadaceae bacterium]|jgi:phosphoserine phosphatase|nr:HAD family hydrolase [Gemmatimonadaceae bacterium]